MQKNRKKLLGLRMRQEQRSDHELESANTVVMVGDGEFGRGERRQNISPVFVTFSVRGDLHRINGGVDALTANHPQVVW
jgi:hypothetical protein